MKITAENTDWFERLCRRFGIDDCTQALHGVIEPQANGTLRGTFRDAKFTVVLSRAPDSAFGGASYGGDGYGGFSDGGAVYGGTPRK